MSETILLTLLLLLKTRRDQLLKIFQLAVHAGKLALFFSPLFIDLFLKGFYFLYLPIENAPSSPLIIGIDIFGASDDTSLTLSLKFAYFLPACLLHFGQPDFQICNMVSIFIKTLFIASTFIPAFLFEIFDQMLLRYSVICYQDCLHHSLSFNLGYFLFKMIQLYKKFPLFLFDRARQVFLLLLESSNSFDVSTSREEAELRD